MRKYQFLLVLLLIAALCNNVFGETHNYPFVVEKSGTGKQAVILIPGFTCSGDEWQETRTVLEKEFTCYTLTMAGFAGVPSQPNANFKNREEEIARYIKDQKIDKPILIGHSMGGGWALAIAADYPELPSKIIVVDALPCLAAMMNPSFQQKEKVDCSPIVNRFTGMSDEQFLTMQKMSIASLVADTSKRDLIVSWSVKSDRQTFAEMYCSFSNTDLREKISTIQCPAMVLLESGFIAYQSAIEAQYAKLKQADLRYATKGLHFIMYDDKEWYLEQINNFLKGK